MNETALFGGVELLPTGLGDRLLIGQPVARELGILKVVLVDENGGHRNALRKHLLVAVDDRTAHGGQFFHAVVRLARAFRVALPVDQLDLHQTVRQSAQPEDEDRAQDDAATLKR